MIKLPESFHVHHRRVSALTERVEHLQKNLPTRARLLAGVAQALRVALAASLGYYGALTLGLPQGFWAAITAISVTQTAFAEVRNSSRDQVIGALIGGVIGLGGATLGHDHYLAYLLAVMVGTVVCWLANLGAAGRVSAITTTIILLVPHTGPFWGVALMRLGEVTLGVLSALLVTLLWERVRRALLHVGRD